MLILSSSAFEDSQEIPQKNGQVALVARTSARS